MNENEPIDILDALMEGGKEETLNNKEVLKAIDDAKKAGFIKGVKVKHIADNEIGKVVGHNRKIKGDNSGDKYPIKVKFDRGIVAYGIKALEIVK